MFRKAVVFTALLFFVAGQMAYAAAPELNIAGQVRGAGTADMKTAAGWISVSDKSYPVANGAGLVTGSNGGMTITLKNGVRLELGKNSEVTVSSAKGNYSVVVQRGTLAYYVPGAAQLGVNTANTRMTAGPLSRGFLGQGKDTFIKSIAGNLMVISSSGPGSAVVKTGETIRVARGTGKYEFTPVSYDETAIESAIASAPAPFADASAGSVASDAGAGAGAGGTLSTTGLIVGGVLIGGAIAAVATTTSSGSSSPY